MPIRENAAIVETAQLFRRQTGVWDLDCFILSIAIGWVRPEKA